MTDNLFGFSQYTPPTAAAEYVHRVGRTARIGARGSSLLFLTPAETAFITELANHNIRFADVQCHAGWYLCWC